jgi:ABC-type microcin C transport system permease subunit YejB
LHHWDRFLDDLNPVVQQAAGGGNSIVVMVCNYGQAELFHNFVCNARAKGLSISKVLIFATDVGTLEVAKQLGYCLF